MKDGHYKIIFGGYSSSNDEELGSFVIENGNIKSRRGLALDVLEDGPVTPSEEFRIRRLNNGYNRVVMDA